MDSFLVRVAAWIICTVFFPVMNWWNERRRRGRSEHWVTTPGTIRYIQVEPMHFDMYTKLIGYAYSVNGQNYPGLIQGYFAWVALAARYVPNLHAGMSVVIRYDPSNPDNSTLRMDDQPMLMG